MRQVLFFPGAPLGATTHLTFPYDMRKTGDMGQKRSLASPLHFVRRAPSLYVALVFLLPLRLFKC